MSLIGPGSTEDGSDSPVFTMLTIAVVILSTNALISASVLPETDTSFAMTICAIDRLFFSACVWSSFIVEYGYFGAPFFGGS